MGTSGLFRGRRPLEPAPAELAVERQPGETIESYEPRRAAYANEGIGARSVREREAYAEGRRDQHRREHRPRRRRGFGWAGLIVVVVAALGVLWVALAAREGSFAAGGAVVDEKIAD